MDIFVRNVPPNSTAKQLEKALSQPLQDCGISVYHIEKRATKPFAVVTVLDSTCGQEFLRLHGIEQDSSRRVYAPEPLRWDGIVLKFTRDRYQSEFTIRALAYEASQQAARNSQSQAEDQRLASEKRFTFRDLHCGSWDYDGNHLALTSHYHRKTEGMVAFGRKQAIIMLKSTSHHVRIDLNYHLCQNIVLGTNSDPSVSFTIDGVPPKFYKASEDDPLSDTLALLSLAQTPAYDRREPPKKIRLTSIDYEHAKIAGACFVYRINLKNPGVLSPLRTILAQSSRSPSTFPLLTPLHFPRESWERSKMLLDNELHDASRFGSQSFSLRFQLARLAINGRLAPSKVLGLVPTVRLLQERYGPNATVNALRDFYSQLSPAGPLTEAIEHTTGVLQVKLEDLAQSYDPSAPNNPYEVAKRHKHVVLIHRVFITPAAMYLDGPAPEPTNRVLREYSDQTDHFLRVVFQDEDRAPIRYDPRSSQEIVYQKRFKQVLDGSIVIAGTGFSFLGFSHSSLRTQSCWYMSPVVLQEH